MEEEETHPETGVDFGLEWQAEGNVQKIVTSPTSIVPQEQVQRGDFQQCTQGPCERANEGVEDKEFA